MIELEIAEAPCCTPEGPALLDADRAERLAEAFKALSDPTRVRLLLHLAESADGTACACHLPDELGISQPTMSHHMKRLVDAGLVDREQRGRWAHFTVRAEALEPLQDILTAAAGSTAPRQR
ncbi:ArsR/SmtB family transcription factor [Demequina pelophila]|uniref:ArsR/SmtB family transcription factor n=1 Tax=Demequina pelophila TaxID=1638984 RepID=UPI00078089E7|nr:metalloregulator ArsR/SmtB family transcription factor [Demequina pelophila]